MKNRSQPLGKSQGGGRGVGVETKAGGGAIEDGWGKKLAKILVEAAASSEISATSLAKSLDRITPHKILQLLGVLTKAEFLIKARPYGSVYKGVRKSAKYYFMSPALRHTLLLEVNGESAFKENKGTRR